MGHAVYASAGEDYNAEIECPFEDPKDVFVFDPIEIYGTIDKSLWTKKFNEHLDRNLLFCVEIFAIQY